MPEEKVLCIVCGSPSAIFTKTEDGKIQRLAKTMTRVTGRKSEPLYVHDAPCLPQLVSNWAKYAADNNAKSDLQTLGTQGAEDGTTV